jgi:hypothetical protein
MIGGMRFLSPDHVSRLRTSPRNIFRFVFRMTLRLHEQYIWTALNKSSAALVQTHEHPKPRQTGPPDANTIYLRHVITFLIIGKHAL